MEDNILLGVILSPNQKRIWSLQNETSVFNLQCIVEIGAKLCLKALEACLNKVVANHDILRTSFVKRADLAYPLQVVEAPNPISLIVHGTIRNITEIKELATFEQVDDLRKGDQPLKVEVYPSNDDYFFLKITLPAMAADTYSILYLVNEIGKAYCNQDDEATRTDGIAYTLFSQWQNELMASPDEHALDFWERYPYEANNVYVLPFIRSHVESQDFVPKLSKISVSSEINDGLLNANENNQSAEFILMACFSMLLHRLVNTDQLTLGYQPGNRNYKELENTIGFITKIIPVIAKIDEKMSFAEFVADLENEILLVREWEDYFGWKDGDTSSSTPYFQSLFQYIDLGNEIDKSEKNKFAVKHLKGIVDRFEISLNVQKNGDHFLLALYYNSLRLDAESIKVLIDQYCSLLGEVLKSPEIPIIDIYRKSNERKVPIKNYKSFGVGDKNILDLFYENVRQNGDKVAIQDGEETVTFNELNAKSDLLAAYLAENEGVGCNDIVALSVRRSVEMIVIMLGIIKTGAAYLPIDSKTPKERIKFMLNNSAAALLITDHNVNLDKEYPKILLVDKFFWSNLPVCEKKTHMDIDPRQVAYVIYTSGSTGQPKGVMISHDALVNYVRWFITKYQVGYWDKSLLFSSIAFDLCYTGLWSSILSGATLVMHKDGDHLDPIDFINDLIANKITYIKLTPSHFSLIMQDPEFEIRSKAYQLRLIVLGGEEVITSDVANYLKYNPVTEFVNHYGPTETTIGVLVHDITHENLQLFKQRPVIGKPIDNTDVFILNEMNEQMAIGQMGEICIAGRGLANGYLNNDQLSAEKFVVNPFYPIIKMYRTGDLGQRMPDGTIAFMGRKDFQIKIRGFRIELGEIEHNVSAYPGVESVNVQLFKHPETNENQMIAFLVPNELFKLDELRTYLEERLPFYMIPSEFFQISGIPLLKNGKVDRKSLLEEMNKKADNEYKAPATGEERLLVEIWQEILLTDQIGVNDNFFSLGGHSLKAAQLVTRIYKSCHKKIELKEVFDNPTIAQLALLVENAENDQYKPIEPVPEKQYYEVSHAQKRLWILNHFQKDKIPYNSPCYFKIKGCINYEILSKAFQILIERHESLRTTFVEIDGEPKQKINDFDSCGFKLKIVDLRHKKNPYQIAMDRAASDTVIQFNLEKGPLFTAKLFRIADDYYLLACNIHHIISDGWSLRILYDELLILYDDFIANRESSLQPLKIQYKDYSAWHQSITSKKEEEYWLKKLVNYPELINLPYNNIFEEDNIPYLRYSITFSEKESLDIKKIANRCNTTVSNFILSIYSIFINQITGRHDFLIGVGHANRNHGDTEPLIGFFINMLAIRIQFSPDDTLQNIIKKVSDSSMEAYENSNFPFDLLIEKLCKKRYADRQPILNVMYDFKNFNDVLIESHQYTTDSRLEIEMIKVGEYVAAHDLILHVMDNGQNISYDFEYKKECFLPETVQNFYDVFNKLAKLIIEKLSHSKERVFQ